MTRPTTRKMIRTSAVWGSRNDINPIRNAIMWGTRTDLNPIRNAIMWGA